MKQRALQVTQYVGKLGKLARQTQSWTAPDITGGGITRKKLWESVENARRSWTSNARLWWGTVKWIPLSREYFDNHDLFSNGRWLFARIAVGITNLQEEYPEPRTKIRNKTGYLSGTDCYFTVTRLGRKKWSSSKYGTKKRHNMKGCRNRTRDIPHKRSKKGTEITIPNQAMRKRSRERARHEDVEEPYNWTRQLWNSPVVSAREKDGSYRFCVDFRRLDLITVWDFYRFPRMNECTDRLEDEKYLFTLDWNWGYWKIPLKKFDKENNTLMCH